MSFSLACGVLLVAASSRSEVSAIEPSLSPTPIDEPITGSPIVPAPGTTSSTPPKDPFAPYDTGPGTWSYADLNAAEKELADRGRDTTGWSQINDAFASASGEQAGRAAASAAASQLGISDVATLGVVP